MFRYFITIMLVAVFFQHAFGQIYNDSNILKQNALKGVKVSDSIKHLMPSLKVVFKNANEKVNETIIPEFNDLKNKLFAKKDGFKLNNLSLNFSSIFFDDTTTGRIFGTFKNQNVQMAYSVEVNTTLMFLPFSIVMRGNNNYEYSQNTQFPLHKFNFDPQKYTENHCCPKRF